ncbi:MAG TPA: metalloregulator ArsR/SmtB family transcription factor [Marinagarivorans sp.]|nr:metalloregulator ArsR/SmtB family transcription factor [Cellvibrionaceae bacterium]HMY41306.1 metalloregulator ArsR/SmtB family transcription factor [Marinagarivorans sp.]HNG59990.1 metalloregulator ArsR/SmtB family transcription factor [Cellvibrionaceae bacterium]
MNPLELFKALADPTRLACVLTLQARGELCVCELHELLAVSQPKMSRHLAQLRKAQVLTQRKKGLWVYYQLNPQMPAWALQIIQHTALGNRHLIPAANAVCGPGNIC